MPKLIWFYWIKEFQAREVLYLEENAPGYLRAGMGRALRVDPEALGLKLSSLTGYKLPGIRFYRRILC